MSQSHHTELIPGTESSPGASTARRTLYDSRFERDACGVGFIARASGAPGNEILQMALEAVRRLAHRGAVAADGKSGDGAGVLTQIPRRLFLQEAERLGFRLEPNDPLAVGMLFLPPGDEASGPALSDALREQGVHLLGWRDVPLGRDALGAAARATLPVIRQALILPAPWMDQHSLERRLYRARKQFERANLPGYVCSLSGQTIVYKALCAAHQLDRFYMDLADPRYETGFALFHQRYSTNTLPSWPLAQPMRVLAHNGEINTLWGNRAWMRTRESDLPPEVRPVLTEDASDSASLDEALELLARNGRDGLHGLAMLIVPAWESTAVGLSPEARAFYRYHAPLMEPWDGPAALTFADSRYVGAAMDRNGLRPCRYKITRGGLVVAGSEVGLVDVDPEAVVEKGRLGPGDMLVVDIAAGRVLHDREIKEELSSRHSFAAWLGARFLAEADATENGTGPAGLEHDLFDLQSIFGFTNEELRLVLGPMAEQGKQATWSMGDDTPVPPLARAPRSLYAFFRERFAQVTNPAIDPLRETSVMSLRTWLGPRPPLLSEGPQDPLLELPSPVLTEAQAALLRRQDTLSVTVIDCLFEPGAEDLRSALERTCDEAEAAVHSGTRLVVLTDRGVGPSRAPIPMVFALGAVHHHLLRTGLRTRVDLVVEAGDCWDVHHLAVLVGYGAGAVCPWLALATARARSDESEDDPVSSGDGPGGVQPAESRMVRAFELGLLKIMSKMGICTVASYRGGQLFEVLGFADEIVDRCFTGTPNQIAGLGFEDIEQAVRARHASAFDTGNGKRKLADHGLIRYRRGDAKEHHGWAPPIVRALQRSVGSEKSDSDEPDPAAWEEVAELSTAVTATLRDLLDFVPAGPAVPLEEVEPVEAIVRRFVTSPMSLGALSPEAHRTLAIAMNRLGGRSNTGEGGEDPEVYGPSRNGDRADAKVKQVASGRFGVTTEYVARAEELEIKIAQGSKPGEGGQLPGHKVTELIARLRHSQPGVPLISPPPHHDIYSIEDLAQLIYDLKRCNPAAKVGVKLVSEAGVGTIAAGVAKAYADYVFICGHSGGTGASPLSSIKYAGSPWEIGLAETQQVLIRNGLRSRIRVRVDGGLMTGRDVVVGALLGAEEFGFGTGALVALGCDMARQCHLNTCPTGVATQNPELRAKFRGRPEHVVRYFRNVAESIRRILAELGLRSLDEAVGRVDLLRQVAFDAGLDLSALLARVEGDAPRCLADRNDRPEEEEPLDEPLAREALAAMESGDSYRGTWKIRNRDRSIGARLAGALAVRYGLNALEPGTVELRFEGTAGQSFGAFCTKGMRLVLDGEANDYVGKGLCGGELVLRPIGAARSAPERNVILGNVALYGATGGRLFAAGWAGERFGVRNSGADAVVEGVGDHGCEYMTGGCVVVLGETGVNFGAGMTGGVAYVLDRSGRFPTRVNPEVVEWTRPTEADLDILRTLIQEHVRCTESVHAASILDHWDEMRGAFWKVRSPLSDRAPDAQKAADDGDRSAVAEASEAARS